MSSTMSLSQPYRVGKAMLLLIAEHCDLDTLSSLLRTNKDIYSLISSYQESICEGKLRGLAVPPAEGTIYTLTSETEDRVAIAKKSFEAIQEFERRERRINSLLETGNFLRVDKQKQLDQDAEASKKFKACLKRALLLTDRLADALPRSDGEDARAGRRRQLSILGSLDTQDLLLLHTLTSLAGKGYTRYHDDRLLSDPNAFERITAFQEMLLRQGSFILWAFVRGNGPMTQYAESWVRRVVQEIVYWEVGYHGMLPGLHMTMVGELRKRLNCKRRNLSKKLDELLAAEIGKGVYVFTLPNHESEESEHSSDDDLDEDSGSDEDDGSDGGSNHSSDGESD